MARAHLRYIVLNQVGVPLPDISVNVYQVGTTTPITDVMYDSRLAGAVKTNPLTSNGQGEVEAWIDSPGTNVPGYLDLKVNTPIPFTETVEVWDPSAVASGSVAADPIFDAKGDLPVGTANNTSAKLTVGANDTILMADSGETTGLKYAASATPTTQAFGDVAAVGTGDTFTRGDHVHGMPANPVTAAITTKGDILVGGAAGAPTRLGVGANDTILMADSGETTGLKYAGPGTPTSQAFGDTAAEGSADGYARSDHLHGIPADPVTAHAAAADPHTGYVLETLPDAKGDLFTATAADTPARLAVGSDNQILIADSSTATGIKWGAAPTTSIATDTIWAAKGDIVSATANDAAAVLTVGTNGQILSANSGMASGLEWITAPSGAVATDVIWDAKGDLAAGTGANTSIRLAVGTNGQVLSANSGTASGLEWVTSAPVMATDTLWDAKGDLAAGTGANTAARLAVGANGRILTAASGETTGLAWSLDPVTDAVTTKGDLIVGTAADTMARLAAGTNYFELVADSATATGLKYRSAGVQYVEDYGAVRDGTTNDSAAFAAAVTALPADGGTIQLLPGIYKLNSTWTLNKKVVVRGAGTGGTSGAGTILLVAAGVTGISVEAFWCHLSDFTVKSQSTILGTDDGIVFVDAAHALVENVVCHSFGRDGFHSAPSPIQNNDLMTWINLSSQSNKRRGFSIDAATDDHQSTFINLDAQQNDSYGLYNAGRKNVFLNCHFNSNDDTTKYDIYEAGDSGYWLTPYVENEDGTHKFHLGVPDSGSGSATNNEVHLGGPFGKPTMSFSSAAVQSSNHVYEDFGFRGPNAVWLVDYAGPTVNKWNLASKATGQLTLGHITGIELFKHIVSESRLRFPSAVQFESTTGFNGTAPIAKPTISGDCRGNTAIDTMAAALGSYGLATDTTTLGTNNALATDTLFDAKGDLVAGTGADAAAKVTVGSNGQVLTANSAISTGVEWTKPITTLRKTANQSSVSTTLADVTDLTTSVTSGVTYIFDFEGTWESAATTTGLSLSINGPASPTNFRAEIEIYKNTGTAPGTGTGTQPVWVGAITTLDSAITNDSAQATAVPMKWRVHGLITPSANGTLALRFASETGTSVTIHANSRGLVFSG